MDGCGEFGDESGVAEAVSAIGDAAGAVEDDDGRESFDAEEIIQAIGKDYRGARFYFVEIGRDEGFIVVAIG